MIRISKTLFIVTGVALFAGTVVSALFPDIPTAAYAVAGLLWGVIGSALLDTYVFKD